MKNRIIYLLVVMPTLLISSHGNAATISSIKKVNDLWSMVENSEGSDSWTGNPEMYGLIYTRKNRDGKRESKTAEIGNRYNSPLSKKWEVIYYLSNGEYDMSVFAVNNGDKTATLYELGELVDGAEYGFEDLVQGSTKAPPEQLTKAEFLAELIHDNGAVPVSLVSEYWNGVGKTPEVTKYMRDNGIDGLYYFTSERERIVRNASENHSKLSQDWDVIYYSGGKFDGEIAFLNKDNGTAYVYPPRNFKNDYQ